MKNAIEIMKRATGKNINIVKTDQGYKVDDSYVLTSGDCGRIEAGFRALGICSRVRPGRWAKIWIKPEHR